jgi:xanthine dehydrogenase accessory factor
MNNADTVFDTARRLQQAGTPCALVSVVKALSPASAHAGDKAVVTADGEMHGWVGGGCAQPAVVRTVRQALADGRARMIRIAPASEAHERDLDDVLEFGMACHSGGTLELFIDPLLPRAEMVVIGNSPVATSLVQLAPRVGFAVTVVAQGAHAEDHPDAYRVFDRDDAATVAPHVGAGAWVVIATQGRRDLQALGLALALDARQVSFVASARKAQVLKDSLLTAGADSAAVAAIVAPAGYPISASTPEEIALSVLAAVVSSRRGTQAAMRMQDAAPEPALEVPGEPAHLALAQPAASSCCGGGGGGAVHAPPARELVNAGSGANAAVAAKPSCCGGG